MAPSGRRKQPRVEKPGEPNRGRQKKAQRYSARPAQRAAQNPLPQCVDGESRKRCDLDGDRDHLPVEPDAGDAGELDVAETDTLASAQPTVERAQQQESERQRRAADGGKRESFKRAVPICNAGVDQAQAQPDRNQYIGNNELPRVDDGDGEHAEPEAGAQQSAQFRRRHDARNAHSDGEQADGHAQDDVSAGQCAYRGVGAPGGRPGAAVRGWPVSLVRSCSATKLASTLSRMICGRMNMMSSVRESFEILRNQICSTHVHDNDKVKDLHLWPGQGTIDWKEAVELLRSAPQRPPLLLKLGENEKVNALDKLGETFDKLETTA